MLHGLLVVLPFSLITLIVLGTFLALGYRKTPLLISSIVMLVELWLFGLPTLLFFPLAAVLLVFNVTIMRQWVIGFNVMTMIKKLNLFPRISDTERVALKAGSVWVDGDLFSGNPNLKRIMSESYRKPSDEEQAFLDGPCETVCQMHNDDEALRRNDLSPEVWAFLKKERFFGIIIPKEYGGLGFSALGHSEIVNKLATRAQGLAITVMVPNSLGPAELIMHYGTKEQKDYYLPRLADGRELPCFALTEPGAGSDAGSIQALAVVFRDSAGTVCLRLNWQKRYITLGSVATVIALGTQLEDPENILGRGTDLGITCVLVPANLPGVSNKLRHNPLGVPFHNAPIDGVDVILPISNVIGGDAGIGRGWVMLMESLAAGRSISLPSNSAGNTKMVARAIGAYAGIREQFGIAISNFEGIQEPLAQIGGLTYLMEATRVYTVGAVDRGLKPAVVSAIAKLVTTELNRKVSMLAMDIAGGSGISMGPRNLLAQSYISAPIAVTVEGANILTRTMIIFGQGMIRCHPYALAEIEAIEANSLEKFDKAFAGHLGHIISNLCRTIVLSVTRGYFLSVPEGAMGAYYRKLVWSSAVFATMTDIAMIGYGGSLKLKERLTGRYADVLSWMYLITATLRRFEAEGQQKEHAPCVHYAVSYGFARIQEAFDGIFRNIDLPIIGKFFQYPVAIWSRLNSIGVEASDHVGQQVAQGLTTSSKLRDAVTGRSIYIPKDAKEPLARLEYTLGLMEEARRVYKKIHQGIKAKIISPGRPQHKVEEALQASVISKEEAEVTRLAVVAQTDAIQVDAFPANLKRAWSEDSIAILVPERVE